MNWLVEGAVMVCTPYVGVKGGWSCGVVGYESELRMWLMPGIIWQMEFRRDMLLSRG